MSLLQAEAAAAYAAYLAAWEAALEVERKAMRSAALNALKAVLVKEDPATGTATPLTLEQLGMTRKHFEVDTVAQTGLVVWSDGTNNIGAQLEAGSTTWRVRLVRMDAGSWAAFGDRRIRNLVELHEALTAAG